MRDDRRRSEAVVLLDQRLDAVGGKHFERRVLGGAESACVSLPIIDRAVDAFACAVFADGLRNGENMRLGETCRSGGCRDARWCRS